MIIGTTLSDGVLPLCVDELEDLSTRLQRKIWLSVIGNLPVSAGSHFRDVLIDSAVGNGAVDRAAVAEGYADLFSDTGATHVSIFHISVVPGSGLSIMDLADVERTSLWHL